MAGDGAGMSCDGQVYNGVVQPYEIQGVVVSDSVAGHKDRVQHVFCFVRWVSDQENLAQYDTNRKEVDNLTQRIEEANCGKITTKNYAILNSVIDRYEEDIIQSKNHLNLHLPPLFQRVIPLTYSQQQYYETLIVNIDNSHITIKEADKGGNIVILNTDDYLKEAYRQLQDKTYDDPIRIRNAMIM
ncbi:hypothetical protein NDU88_001862 [Pleurodeles waltl]|uniref:Uncharacterized protein n=1 Tax=Pleurodeles waltl TaxID=8319 RepID=A0AAV7WJM2_PLEWA|nr:hypothetical protein NDU88_001862 [Pleurodeles waltl]